MSDVVSRLSEREIADLCALADGTLPAERRAAVEERVAASPELQELVDRQRRAVAQTRALASEPVPESLRAAVEEQRREKRRPLSRPLPRLGFAGALAATVAVVVIVLSGGSAAPTVADAAGLTTRAPSAPGPPPAGRTRLSADVEGVAFPNLRPAYGWRAVGQRRDELDGRRATTVFYAKGGRRVAYVIVGGRGLERPSDARTVTRQGVLYQTLRLKSRPAVTWRRAGHTCVLIGPAPRAELLALASY